MNGMGTVVCVGVPSAMDTRNISLPVLEEHGKFFEKILRLVMRAAFHDTQRSAPVIRWRDPKYLKEILDLKLAEDGASDDQLFACLENIVKFSAKTGHPHFINQLFSGYDFQSCDKRL